MAIREFKVGVSSPAFITDGGTASQFVKGDGTLDLNVYLTDAIISITPGTGLDITAGNTPTLTLDFTEFSIGGTLIATDYLVAVNGGVENRQLISNIPLGIFNNDQNWTPNLGTVTSVGATSPILSSSGGTTPVITHATTTGYKHIPSGGSSGDALLWSADGTAVWGAIGNTNTQYEVVTSDAATTVAVANTNYTFSNSAGNFNFTALASGNGDFTDIFLQDINSFNITNTVTGGEPAYADGMMIRVLNPGLSEIRVFELNADGGAGGTVTSVSSATTNQLTVANGTTTPSLSIVTGAVADLGTALATGDQIYDFVIGLGYTSNIGDITGVNITAGTGLTGSQNTTSGQHTQTISVDYLGVDNYILSGTINNGGLDGGDYIAFSDSSVLSGTVSYSQVNAIDLTQFNNSAGWNNYSHPDHTGQVTSTGDGATALTVSAITAQTALTTGLAGTDELLINNNNVLKRMDVSVMNAYFNANLNFGSGDGIVESLTTTGTSGAATLIAGVLNIPNYATGSTPNDATITLSAGTGLTTGGAFTTDQAANETITFNVGTGNGINVGANDVAVEYGNKTPANNVIVAADIANVSSLPAPTPSGTDSIIFNVTSTGLVFQKTFGSIPLSTFNDDLVYNNYVLPLATATVRGGIELFSNTDNPTAANSVTSTAGRTYGLQLNTANQGVVNVPWTDTVYTHPNHTGQVTSTGDGATVVDVSAITAQTALTSGLAGTDELLVSDNGVLKKMDVSVMNAYFNANLSFGTGTMSSWIIKDGDTTTTTVTNGETVTIANSDFIVSNLTSTTSGGTITLSVDYATTNAWTRSQFFSATTANGTGGTWTWNCDRDQVQVLTLTGNIGTFSAPDTGTQNAGGIYTLIIKQSGASTFSISSWASVYKWPGGVAPTITTGAGAVDIITFISDGTNMYGTVAQDFS